MAMIAPRSWVSFQSASDAALMISLGLFGGLGHYCVARAMTYGPANILSPFQYWQMIGSVIVGYLISSKWPDAMTWLGASIVIGAGLFIGLRETRDRRTSVGN